VKHRTDSCPPTLYLPSWTCKYLWRKCHCIHPSTRSAKLFYDHSLASTLRSASHANTQPPAGSAVDPHCWSKTTPPQCRPPSSRRPSVASNHHDPGAYADVARPPAATTSKPVPSTVLEYPRPTSRHRGKSSLSFSHSSLYIGV
jgi:hypothetical protein